MSRTAGLPSFVAMARAASWVNGHTPRLARLLFAGAALLVPWLVLPLATLLLVIGHGARSRHEA